MDKMVKIMVATMMLMVESGRKKMMMITKCMMMEVAMLLCIRVREVIHRRIEPRSIS